MTLNLSSFEGFSDHCDNLSHYSGDFQHVTVRRNWEPVLTDLFSKFPVAADAAAWRAASSFHLSVVPVVAVGLDVANVLVVVALRKASLSSV
jgi:hypothetical protein